MIDQKKVQRSFHNYYYHRYCRKIGKLIEVLKLKKEIWNYDFNDAEKIL